ADVLPTAFAPNYTYTQFLKFMQGKVFLFDEDRQGLPYLAVETPGPPGSYSIAEGRSIGGNYSNIDLKYPFMFDPPIIFPQGQELTVYWKCTKEGTGCNISIELQEVGLILKMTPAL
ncbi:unnamed protein product, partial [marine sediment metagenome]